MNRVQIHLEQSPQQIRQHRFGASLIPAFLFVLMGTSAYAGPCRDDTYCATGFSCQPVRKTCNTGPLSSSCLVKQCLPVSRPRPPQGEPTEANLSCGIDKTPAVVFDVFAQQKHIRVALSGNTWARLLRGDDEAFLPPEMVTVCEEISCRMVGGAIKMLLPATARTGAHLGGIVFVNDPGDPGYLPFRAVVQRPDPLLVCG